MYCWVGSDCVLRGEVVLFHCIDKLIHQFYRIDSSYILSSNGKFADAVSKINKNEGAFRRSKQGNTSSVMGWRHCRRLVLRTLTWTTNGTAPEPARLFSRVDACTKRLTGNGEEASQSSVGYYIIMKIYYLPDEVGYGLLIP